MMLVHSCCTIDQEEWKNDAHMAIGEFFAARKIDNSSYKALYYMSEALSLLDRHEDALDFVVAFIDPTQI